MIKSSYIERILGISVEEYDRMYPGARRSSSSRVNKIKKSLKEIDNITGLTKHGLSAKKTKEKLLMVDKNGLTGYKKKGQKTRNTHMRKIDENGLTGYQRQALYRRTTILDNGLTIEQNAHIKQIKTMLKNNKTFSGASIQSRQALSTIVDFLNNNKIKYYFDKNEYGIKSGSNYYFYDLTIPDFKTTIEYQSNAWHADPTLDEDSWHKWKTFKGTIKTATEVLTYDYNKARALYKARGFVTFYVWENSVEKDIKDILCWLKTTMNTKS